MKKLSLLAALCLLIFGLTACQNTPDPSDQPPEDNPEVDVTDLDDTTDVSSSDPAADIRELDGPTEVPNDVLSSLFGDPEIPASIEDMALSLEPTAFTEAPERITAILHNNSAEGTWFTGNNYTIEQLVDGQWVDITPVFAVTSIGILVSPGDSYEFDLRLFPDQIDYVTGTYRIVKDELTAEFSVNLD